MCLIQFYFLVSLWVFRRHKIKLSRRHNKNWHPRCVLPPPALGAFQHSICWILTADLWTVVKKQGQSSVPASWLHEEVGGWAGSRRCDTASRLMTLAIGRHLDSLCSPIYWATNGASALETYCRAWRDVPADRAAPMICCRSRSKTTNLSPSSVDRIGDN